MTSVILFLIAVSSDSLKIHKFSYSVGIPSCPISAFLYLSALISYFLRFNCQEESLSALLHQRQRTDSEKSGQGNAPLSWCCPLVVRMCVCLLELYSSLQSARLYDMSPCALQHCSRLQNDGCFSISSFSSLSAHLYLRSHFFTLVLSHWSLQRLFSHSRFQSWALNHGGIISQFHLNSIGSPEFM